MNLLRALANIWGYDLVKKKKSLSIENHTINLIKQNKINLVLDVGANIGQFAKTLRESGYRGEIHSFEPVLETYQLLKEAAQPDPKWYPHNFALGSKQGDSVINVTKASDFASILEPNSYGQERFKNNIVTSTQEITISTLDIFLTEHIADAHKKNIFLKMDTQGYDLEVFFGCKAFLNNIKCLLSELSFTPIYEGMPHYLEALKIYERHGYKITNLYPISHQKENLSLIEMDCIMVKAS